MENNAKSVHKVNGRQTDGQTDTRTRDYISAYHLAAVTFKLTSSRGQQLI